MKLRYIRNTKLHKTIKHSFNINIITKRHGLCQSYATTSKCSTSSHDNLCPNSSRAAILGGFTDSNSGQFFLRWIAVPT